MTSRIKQFLRKNDSDNEVKDSWYPTFNDMVRMGESDTDSDMPALVEIGENSPSGHRSDSAYEDLNLEELRELVATHLILADQGARVATSDDSQECGIGKQWAKGWRV